MTVYSILTMVDIPAHVRSMPNPNPSEHKHFSLNAKHLPIALEKLPGASLTKKKKPSPSSKTKPGRAAKALKEMRLKVYHVIPGEKLTLAQMAKECKMLGADGKPSASSYQYTEESVGDFFPLDKVRQVTPPLSRRGIPVAEIERKLLGETSQVEGNAKPVVGSSPGQSSRVRSVPVVTREFALLILKGEFEIHQLVKAPTADKQWEIPGVVIDWQSIPRASDQTIIFDVLDGSGRQIAVDKLDRKLVDGKSYVWTVDGKSMFFSRWLGGVMIAREGPDFGRVLPFDPEVCTVLGRVIKSLNDE